MQTLELNKMGLAPMEEVEMQEIEGGGIKDGLIGVLIDRACDIVFSKSNWEKLGNCLAKGIPQGPSASRFY